LKIHVFATDILPIPGLPASGTALRTHGFVQGFRLLGHEVIVSSPKQAVESAMKKFPEQLGQHKEQLRWYAFDQTNQTDLILESWPDLIFCGHWPAYMFGRKPPQKVVIDLAGPHLLEHHYQKAGSHGDALHAKLEVLSSADGFIASGKKQLSYFKSFLERSHPMMANRFTIQPMPIDFSMLPDPQQKNNEVVFFFGGVFLPWQNPTWSLNRLVEILETHKTGKLVLIGGPHPQYKITSQVYENLFRKLENSHQVERHPLLPIDQAYNLMAQADVALDLMEWNMERELAITIRTTTSLAMGLPPVYNSYADLSESIVQQDCGWTVQGGYPDFDDDEFTATILSILEDKKIVLEKSARAKSFASKLFCPKKAAQDVIELVTSVYN